MPSDGRKKNLLDLIRTYKNKEKSTKTGGDGTTTKTTTYAKKNLCKSLAKKKKKVQFFPSYHSQKIVPTIKNKHHPTPSYQKVAYTFQNDIQSYQRTVLKLFMKKEKCMRKINN